MFVACIALAAGAAYAAKPRIALTPTAQGTETHTGSNQSLMPTDEFLLDTTRVMQPAPAQQSDACVAFDGTDYLILWSDGRQGRNWVFGARVNQNGTVLDQTGFRVWNSYYPVPSAVAYGGGCFLTASQNWGGDYMERWVQVTGARVMEDISTPDITGFGVSRQYLWDNLSSPVIVFGDSAFLVSWVSAQLGGLYGAFVLPDRTVIGDFHICSPPGMGAYSMAFGNGEFLIVLQKDTAGESDIMGIRLGGGGLPIDSTPFVISSARGDQSSPSVAYDGSDFIVTWQDSRRGSSYSDVYACRVTPSASVLDTGGIRISFGGLDSNPTVSARAGNDLITWRHKPDNVPMGARVTSGGVLLDTAPIRVCRHPSSQQALGTAAGLSNFMVVWSDSSGNDDEVFCNVIDTSGAALDSNGILVTLSANPQSHPAVAGGQFVYFAAWQDDTRGDIYGTRVSLSGTVLDIPALTVTTAPGLQSHPAVAAFEFGTGFLAVWQDERGSLPAIYGARVTRYGQVLDPQGIAISPPGESAMTPAAAWNGTNALVVWRNGGGVYGSRVTPNGQVLDSAGIPIMAGASRAEPPAVASHGEDFFVVWATGARDCDIYGAGVNADGQVVNSPFLIAANAFWQEQPALACCESLYGLIFQDGRLSDEHNPHYIYDAFDIFFTRIQIPDLIPDSEQLPLTTSQSVQQMSAIAFDGARFVTSWVTQSSDGTDLDGRWLDTRGQVVASLPPIIHDDGYQLTPALAAAPDYQVLLVYNGWANVVDGKFYGESRIWGKLVQLLGVSEEPHSVLPRNLTRVWVTPTPARGPVTIHYLIAQPTLLRLSVLDATGRTVYSESRARGDLSKCSFVWNGQTDRGTAVRSGVYLYVLRVGSEEMATGKIALTR